MPRRPHEKLPTDPSLLEGLTKAAILLLTLDSLQAAAVLKQMSAEGVEEVTRELAGLGRVPVELQRAVVEEFYSTALAMQSASEGKVLAGMVARIDAGLTGLSVYDPSTVQLAQQALEGEAA